jgi:RNA polymerase sigma-70 factor (ECF subfamily)
VSSRIFRDEIMSLPAVHRVSSAAVPEALPQRGEPASSAAAPCPGFDEVYEREFNYVWRNLGRLGVQPADLPDATHDVFMVLLRRWSAIDRTRTLRPWLFGVARNVAAALRRLPPVGEAVELVTPPGADLADRDLVWRALDTLDEDRRVVIILHDLEAQTGAEIAAMLEIPTNTVHSRLRLARVDFVAAVRRLQRAP